MKLSEVAPDDQTQPKKLKLSDVASPSNQGAKSVAPSMSWGEVGSKALTNLPGSALGVVESTVQPLLHPIDTAVGLGKTVTGEFENATGIRGTNTPAEASENIQHAKALNNYVVSRYGSVEGFKKAAAEDPAGVVADVSTVLSGGGELAARAPGIVGDVGRATADVARAVHPATLAAKGVVTAGKGVAKAGEAIGAPFKRPFMSAQDFAMQYARRALKSDKVSKTEALAAASKPGGAIIDVGKEGMVQAGEQAALSGEGRRVGAELYDVRRVGREQRVNKSIAANASDRELHATVDEISATRAAEARPLYKAAFNAAESMAPFEIRLGQKFNEASAAAHTAAGEVNAAEQALTLAKAKTSRAENNVYGNNSSLAEERTAQSALETAQAKLDAANEQKTAVLEQLRKSQNDKSSGARTGIWSPRLQQFLDDPISRTGLRHGLEVQRLEALAAGEPFNPREYAIVGTDEHGEPVVGSVPNLRTWDAIKRGLDEVLEGYRDKTTGRLVLDQRGRAIESVRKSFVEALDAEAPQEYAAARQAWSGPSRVQDAILKGREFANKDPELISKYLANAPGDVKEGYMIGVARALRDVSSGSERGPIAIAQRIAGSTDMQRRLAVALGPENAAALKAEADEVLAQMRRGNEVLKGSQTARRQEAAREFDQDLPIDDVAAVAKGIVTGRPGTVAGVLWKRFGGWVDARMRGMSEARRAELANLLFSTDPAHNRRAVEMLYQDPAQTPPVPSRTSGISRALPTASPVAYAMGRAASPPPQ